VSGFKSVLAGRFPGGQGPSAPPAVLTATFLTSWPPHRPRLDLRRRRRRVPRSLLFAGARPDGVLGAHARVAYREGALGRWRGRDGEGVRGPQQTLLALLPLFLRVDLPRQVLRDGRLRHDDAGLP